MKGLPPWQSWPCGDFWWKSVILLLLFPLKSFAKLVCFFFVLVSMLVLVLCLFFRAAYKFYTYSYITMGRIFQACVLVLYRLCCCCFCSLQALLLLLLFFTGSAVVFVLYRLCCCCSFSLQALLLLFFFFTGSAVVVLFLYRLCCCCFCFLQALLLLFLFFTGSAVVFVL